MLSHRDSGASSSRGSTSLPPLSAMRVGRLRSPKKCSFFLQRLLCCNAQSRSAMIHRGLTIFLVAHIAIYLVLFAFISYEDIELDELLTSPQDLEAIAELVEWVEADSDEDSKEQESAAHDRDSVERLLNNITAANNVVSFEDVDGVSTELVSILTQSEHELDKLEHDTDDFISPATNLLFLISDQHRADALGRHADLFGSRNFRAKTPYLDKLAEQGVMFANCATYTPQCVPSRTAILTGSSPETNGIHANRDYNDNAPLLKPIYQRILKEQASEGVFTAHFGKWHSEKTQLKDVPKAFDRPANSVAEVKQQYNQWLLLNAKYPRRTNDLKEAKTVKGWPYMPGMKFEEPPNIADLIMKEYKENGVLVQLPTLSTLTQWIANRTIKCLQEIHKANTAAADSGILPKPFAITASFFHPHAPLLVTADMLMLYDLASITVPGNLRDLDPNNPYKQWQKNNRMAAITKFVQSEDGNETRRMITMYLAAVTEVDLAIGRILIELERLKLHHDTLVIYTSDHGDMLGSHGKVDKTPWFYDESLRVPLIMRHPRKIPPAVVVHRPVSTLDIAPTAIDFMLHDEIHGPADASISASDPDVKRELSNSDVDSVLLGMEGTSLRSLIHKLHPGSNDADVDVKESDGSKLGYSISFWENDPPTKWGFAYAVRTERWKLMWNIQHATHALYNLATDPLERHNLLELYRNGGHDDKARCHVPKVLISVYTSLRGCLVNWLHHTSHMHLMIPVEWCRFSTRSQSDDDSMVFDKAPDAEQLRLELSSERVGELADLCSPANSLPMRIRDEWTLEVIDGLDEIDMNNTKALTKEAEKQTIDQSFNQRLAIGDTQEDVQSAGVERLPACQDGVPDFKDARGKTCKDYELQRLCTLYESDELKLWDRDFKSFADQAIAGGLDSRTVCCTCGGGSNFRSVSLPPLVSRVVVLTQRDSGANFVKKYLQYIFNAHPILKDKGIKFHEIQESHFPSGTFVEIREHGKHLISGRDQTASLAADDDIAWFSHWNGNSDDVSEVFTDPATLVLVVTLHPWLWHLSMCTNPSRNGMHMYVTKKGQPLNFQQCLAQEYVVFQEGDFKAETDHDPITNQRFRNISAMREAKLGGYLAAARSARRGAVLRIEDFVVDPLGATSYIQKALGLDQSQVRPELVPLSVECDLLGKNCEGSNVATGPWPKDIASVASSLLSASGCLDDVDGDLISPLIGKAENTVPQGSSRAVMTLGLGETLLEQREKLQSSLQNIYDNNKLALDVELASGYEVLR